MRLYTFGETAKKCGISMGRLRNIVNHFNFAPYKYVDCGPRYTFEQIKNILKFEQSGVFKG
jgi:hypothetical protein